MKATELTECMQGILHFDDHRVARDEARGARFGEARFRDEQRARSAPHRVVKEVVCVEAVAGERNKELICERIPRVCRDTTELTTSRAHDRSGDSAGDSSDTFWTGVGHGRPAGLDSGPDC